MAKKVDTLSTTTSAKRRSLSTTVLRAMSLFGGLQVVQILCSAIRIKLVAWLIGPAGVGLFGIYNNVVEMISQISGLGLRQSAVRNVVGLTGQRLGVIAAVIRRWGVWLGLLGAVLTLGFSPVLSRVTFGDSDHTGAFAVLSVVLFMASVTSSEQAVMQGTKMLRRLAVSSLWGVVGGLLVSIPMFIIWRIDSIIPSIIAYALITCIAAVCYKVRTPSAERTLSNREVLVKGNEFLTLGFFMTVAVFLEMLANYLFLSYLNVEADTDFVGYYQSGYTLFNRYIGLVFTAIAMEYYPRLTQVCHSRYRTSIFVSHELSLVLWVIIPIVGVFITGAELIVRVLYTAEFLVIVPFIVWGIVGTVLRAYSWCVAMTMLARGDGRIFIVTESFSAVSGLALNIVCYHQWGLLGLGWAYIVWYVLYSVLVTVVYVKRYHLKLSRTAIGFTAVALTVIMAMTLSYLYLPTEGWLNVIVPGVLTLVAGVWSFRRLKPLLFPV